MRRDVRSELLMTQSTRLATATFPLDLIRPRNARHPRTEHVSRVGEVSRVYSRHSAEERRHADQLSELSKYPSPKACMPIVSSPLEPLQPPKPPVNSRPRL